MEGGGIGKWRAVVIFVGVVVIVVVGVVVAVD